MLGHRDGHHGQLLDLMARRIAGGDQFARLKDVAAATARRPVLDDLVDHAGRKQLAALALMAGLSALLATRRILAPSRRRTGRILARRLRGITRRALALALQLRDSLVLTSDPIGQDPQLLVHPQQQRHDDITALVIDRLGLGPLHTTGFDAPALCPPDQLNAYSFLLRQIESCRAHAAQPLPTWTRSTVARPASGQSGAARFSTA